MALLLFIISNLFYYDVVNVCVFLFMFSILSRRCPLLATSLSVLFCLLSMLISDSRFDLVWFRPSCDHGWIRSGSVNVRKQQITTTTNLFQTSFRLSVERVGGLAQDETAEPVSRDQILSRERG